MDDRVFDVEAMIEQMPTTTRAYWADLRYKGTGPEYLNVVRKIFYRESALNAWLDSKKRTRTGEEAS